MQCSSSFRLAVMVPVLMSASTAIAAEETMSTEIIAAKVRKQGYVCETPKSIGRDPEITVPGQIGWMLECANATYRVMLNPHAAAKVERVEQGGR